MVARSALVQRATWRRNILLLVLSCTRVLHLLLGSCSTYDGHYHSTTSPTLTAWRTSTVLSTSFMVSGTRSFLSITPKRCTGLQSTSTHHTTSMAPVTTTLRSSHKTTYRASNSFLPILTRTLLSVTSSALPKRTAMPQMIVMKMRLLSNKSSTR